MHSHLVPDFEGDEVLAAEDPLEAAMAINVEAMELLAWDGKHPLKNTWVLWYSDRTISKEWKDCIKKIGPFNTVEDFWRFFNFLKPASQLKLGCDLYLFKEGIQPMWEDNANKNGGRWDISIEKSFQKEQFDAYWLELAMAMVGDVFSVLGEIVTGACVTKRDKYCRISIWTTVANEREKLICLGKNIKQLLGLPLDLRMNFRPHEDIAKILQRQNNTLYA